MKMNEVAQLYWLGLCGRGTTHEGTGWCQWSMPTSRQEWLHAMYALRHNLQLSTPATRRVSDVSVFILDNNILHTLLSLTTVYI